MLISIDSYVELLSLTHVATLFCCDLPGHAPLELKSITTLLPRVQHTHAPPSHQRFAPGYIFSKLVIGQIAARIIQTSRHGDSEMSRTRAVDMRAYSPLAAAEQLDHDRAERGVALGGRDRSSSGVNVQLGRRRGACRHWPLHLTRSCVHVCIHFQ